ncbi:DUF512 domain-containing protein, partial [Clostridiaceae bacterium OttesenSCG-928-D20]|nr:DUF512 domain-containing protein [Clostridiaceae bacterium OttesenSCG-928-D20]
MSAAIKSIDDNSPLRRKAAVGDILLSINGKRIKDVLDFKFYSYESELVLVFKTPEGRHKITKLTKQEGEPLGIEFDDYLMDRPGSCSNKCIFCFIDQLPRGMRKSLYFKDDDARLSFLSGNYITFTNLDEGEIQRIIDFKISPINISVHATEPDLRSFMLGNERGGELYPIMQRLSAAGIIMNCQIVLCPDINDGEHLKKTMQDLAALYPQVASVSVVPVGLSRYRERLHPLKAVTREKAVEVLNDVNSFGDECLKALGSRLFYCSDELFLKADLEIPSEDYYEGYPQLENGVGMLRSFEEDFLYELRDKNAEDFANIPSFSIATGLSAAAFFKRLLTENEKCANIGCEIYGIENHFFGEGVNVAGLVTGGDLIAQLRGKNLGERLLIPANMLRHGETVFLDDVSVMQLEAELGVKAEICGLEAKDFLELI